MKRLLLIITLLCTTTHALTFNRSTGTGLASNASNWSTGVAPCGAGGDGVFVVVQTLIVNDCAGIGAATGINGLRIEAGGFLCAYDGIHTNTCGNTSTQGFQAIYFNSTGTNPIGSGSVTNPGSDATAFGLFISYGTFQFLGDGNDQLTLTPANTSYPIYVVHEYNAYSGGIGIGPGGETGGAAQNIHGGSFDITNVVETRCTTVGQTAKFVYRPASLTWSGNVTVGASDGSIQRGQLLSLIHI